MRAALWLGTSRFALLRFVFHSNVMRSELIMSQDCVLLLLLKNANISFTPSSIKILNSKQQLGPIVLDGFT